ncbi:MAG: undecaprenyl-diphosphate phosphatase [Steroidobacteraceae bacterium]|jgi:undecaprenyl-diphosphatase
MPLLLKVLILALVQGVCELLPVSSSAHVVMTEKLLGLDPTAPDMTLLLVMLHTGTMLAVIVYFWSAWQRRYFASRAIFLSAASQVLLATLLTGIIGYGVMKIAVRLVLGPGGGTEVESLFGNLYLMAWSLAAGGALILLSAKRAQQGTAGTPQRPAQAALIGAVQGLCLPFRGFSRSGATISTGLLCGLDQARSEEFSFALAVILTPPVVALEIRRLIRHAGPTLNLHDTLTHALGPSLFGMLFSFLAGLLALRWLSRWLEHGRWHYFGWYCLFAAGGVLAAAQLGL